MRLIKEVREPPPHVLQSGWVPVTTLRTRRGLLTLTESDDISDWKPVLLGSFKPNREESPGSDVRKHCPPRALQDGCRFVDVDQKLTICSDSSHDSGLVLG